MVGREDDIIDMFWSINILNVDIDFSMWWRLQTAYWSHISNPVSSAPFTAISVYLSPPELELIKSFSPRLENRKEEINKAHKWCERVSIRVANQRELLEDDKAVNNGTPCTKDPSSMGLNDQPPQITVILTRGANYLKTKKKKKKS